MHLSKKSKLILAWSVPTAIAVVTLAIATPIIVVDQNNKNKVFNNSKNFIPIPFNEFLSDSEIEPSFNPSNYSVNYFLYGIASNEEHVQKVFSFEKDGLFFENGFWKSSDNVVYTIRKVTSNLVEVNGQYNFNVYILKSFEGATKEYISNISIPSNAFATDEQSMQNFITNNAEEINNLFLTQINRFISNKKTIDEIKSSQDLDIQSSDSNSIFVKDSKTNNFKANVNEFKYSLGNKPILLSVPIEQDGTKLILDAEEAYKINSDGTFDTSSSLYTFLKNQHDQGHLTYLPSLSDEESKGLSDDQKIQKQIEKLIFDPSIAQFYVEQSYGNKIVRVPNSNYQAIVTKIELGSSYTYIVTWSNLFAVTSSIIDSAPELMMKVLQKDNELLTWNQLEQKSNFKYIQPKENPQNGLIYNVTNVSFKDEYKTIADVTVEVTHSDLPAIKQYSTTISSGFKSKAYADLEVQINNLLGQNNDITAIKPFVSISSNSSANDVYNSIYNYSELKSKLLITPPLGISNIEYTIVSTYLENSTLYIRMYLSSVNDVSNYWTKNGSIQYVEVSLNNIVPSTS